MNKDYGKIKKNGTHPNGKPSNNGTMHERMP
jgi:hypothetical protein